jgi:hypothetical protein
VQLWDMSTATLLSTLTADDPADTGGPPHSRHGPFTWVPGQAGGPRPCLSTRAQARCIRAVQLPVSFPSAPPQLPLSFLSPPSPASSPAPSPASPHLAQVPTYSLAPSPPYRPPPAACPTWVGCWRRADGARWCCSTRGSRSQWGASRRPQRGPHPRRWAAARAGRLTSCFSAGFPLGRLACWCQLTWRAGQRTLPPMCVRRRACTRSSP